MQLFWLAQTDADVPPGDEWLSAPERDILARFRVPKRRADWRLGRWTAKCAVAAVLGESEQAAIELRPAASGAPRVFIRGRRAPVAISLSHSHGAGFCVVTREPVPLGCDVEKIEPRDPAFLADYFTEREQSLASRSDELLTALWSAKESALKAVEAGLRADPRSVAVALHPDEIAGGWKRVRADYEGRTFEGGWRSASGFVWTGLAIPPPAESSSQQTFEISFCNFRHLTL